MNENIKRFTKTDWYGFAGAEKFGETDDPFIYRKDLNEGKVELIIIADKTGISVELATDEDFMVWKKDMKLNSIRAYGELEAAVKYVEENNITFAPDLSYTLDHSFKEEDTFYGYEFLGTYN